MEGHPRTTRHEPPRSLVGIRELPSMMVELEDILTLGTGRLRDSISSFLARDETGSADPSRVPIAAILPLCSDLLDMTSEYADLASDLGALPPSSRTVVDLVDLLSRLQASQTPRRLHFFTPPNPAQGSFMARTDPERLLEAIGILLEGLRRDAATPEIELELERGAEECRILCRVPDRSVDSEEHALLEDALFPVSRARGKAVPLALRQLTIAREMVIDLGGHLELEPDAGAGIRLRLTLPAALDPAEAPSARAPGLRSAAARPSPD